MNHKIRTLVTVYDSDNFGHMHTLSKQFTKRPVIFFELLPDKIQTLLSSFFVSEICFTNLFDTFSMQLFMIVPPFKSVF